MELSVIIVNYNVKHFLEQCLISVKKALAGIEGEVIVVDNNSVDGSLSLINKKFSELHLPTNDEIYENIIRSLTTFRNGTSSNSHIDINLLCIESLKLITK